MSVENASEIIFDLVFSGRLAPETAFKPDFPFFAEVHGIIADIKELNTLADQAKKVMEEIDQQIDSQHFAIVTALFQDYVKLRMEYAPREKAAEIKMNTLADKLKEYNKTRDALALDGFLIRGNSKQDVLQQATKIISSLGGKTDA